MRIGREQSLVKTTWLTIGLICAIGGLSFRVLPGGVGTASFTGTSGGDDTTAPGVSATRSAHDFSELLWFRLRDVFEREVKENASEAVLQRTFLAVRLDYKGFEWAAAYSKPSVARMINGAPMPEAEPVGFADPGPDDPPPTYNVTNPEGLQVMEALLFPHYDTSSKEELLSRIKTLEDNIHLYNIYFPKIHFLDEQVLDAAKLEVFRVLSLGLAGFDVPLSLNALPEAAESLNGVKLALGGFPAAPDRDSTLALLDAAVGLLEQSTGQTQKARTLAFNRFDRATFILRYGNPITAGITRMQTQIGIRLHYNRLLRQEAPTLFAAGAFDPEAYLPGPEYATTPEKVLLGKQLFFDTQLSGPGTRSCATCHQPDKAFTDGLIRNIDILKSQPVDRNTPTLINAALQPAQFYDLRATSLEEQARDVMMNPKEMHGSVHLAAQRVGQDTIYRRLFREAFPGHYGASAGAGVADTWVDTTDLLNALGAYVRSLVNLNSRFDRYMRGKAKLTTQEIHGFNLFMGQAKCGTCHYMPLFNGVFPPAYDRDETEVIGVPGARAVGTPGIKAEGVPGVKGAGGPALIYGPVTLTDTVDADPGMFGILPIPFLQHAFKVPTVRNAGRTAPYMHNGVYATLNEVMDFYDKGGGKVNNQTLPTDSLHLSIQDKKDLIAFIKSLDTSP